MKPQFLFRLAILASALASGSCRQPETNDFSGAISIYPDNPFYWEYKVEPVLLIGGSKEDNLFSHPEDLREHLDLLNACGGNYVRNTMSSRNPGNPWAFMKLENGLYDLDQWNDEYWKSNPFNPALNVNYTPEETGLAIEIHTWPAGSPSDHLFFHSPPQLSDIPVVIKYQERFVEKILSITLEYPNVLYCMNNETGEHPEWGVYWANFIHGKARNKGREVFLADMRYSTNLQTEDHRKLLHDRENFDFFEVSQNNNNVNDQLHYDRLIEIREQVVDNPKPLNNVKIYGGQPAWTTSAEEGTRRLWRRPI